MFTFTLEMLLLMSNIASNKNKNIPYCHENQFVHLKKATLFTVQTA